MAGKAVNGSGNGARSGAQALVLLAAPLNHSILESLASGPKQGAELRRATGTPAQTTLRAQLKRLVEIGAVEKRRRNRFPGVLEYSLTPIGQELRFVAGVLSHWLGRAPDGPAELGGGAAKAAVKALVDGWSATMLRALAARALTLTELDGVIAPFSYPALERRLGAMRLAGLVEARGNTNRGTPYAVSLHLRHGVAPLAAAIRWERNHLAEETAALCRIDIEAIFLLTLPLIAAPGAPTGTCRLGMEISGRQQLAGVITRLSEGALRSCDTRMEGEADAWALGTPAAWMTAIVEGDTATLELGGDGGLAQAVAEGLHLGLFETQIGMPP